MTQARTNLSIYDFSDYRTFLKSHFGETKKTNPLWSYMAWSKSLGLSDNSSLLKIMKGKREAGPKLMAKLNKYFVFNQQEMIYFEDLIRLSKVKNDSRLELAIIERMKTNSPRKEFKLLDDRTFSIVSKWWHFAIRQMTKLDSFKSDITWIQKILRFKVDKRELQQAIDTMIEMDLLKKDSQTKKLQIQVPALSSQDDIPSEAVKQHHEAMLDNAKISLRTISPLEREITGQTFTIQQKNLPAAKEYIRNMMDEFTHLFESTQGDEVYQIQTQLFPLTQNSKSNMQNENINGVLQ